MMFKKLLVFFITIFVLFSIVIQVGLYYVDASFSVLTLYTMKWPKNDHIQNNYSEQFFIDKHSYFETQGHFQCAGFSTAYLLRSNGIESDGNSIYEAMNHKFYGGYVLPQSIMETLKHNGLNPKLYRGNLDQLKTRLNDGNPIVVLIGDGIQWQHYVNVVGYDNENIYLFDSLISGDSGGYNRVYSNYDFESLWNNGIPYFSNIYFIVNN